MSISYYLPIRYELGRSHCPIMSVILDIIDNAYKKPEFLFAVCRKVPEHA